MSFRSIDRVFGVIVVVNFYAIWARSRLHNVAGHGYRWCIVQIIKQQQAQALFA